MSKLKKLRAVMAGILCAGLLLVGIGFGVAFGEFSSFTYAGHSELDGMVPRTYSDKLVLEDNARLYISANYSTYDPFNAYSGDPAQHVKLTTDSSVPKGHVKVNAMYRSVYSSLQFNCYRLNDDDSAPEWQMHLYTTPYYASPLAILMAYKDQVLEDIQQNRLGDYDEIIIEQVVITINPADADRIILD